MHRACLQQSESILDHEGLACAKTISDDFLKEPELKSVQSSSLSTPCLCEHFMCTFLVYTEMLLDYVFDHGLS